jgi:hypothetical protein
MTRQLSCRRLPLLCASLDQPFERAAIIDGFTHSSLLRRKGSMRIAQEGTSFYRMAPPHLQAGPSYDILQEASV